MKVRLTSWTLPHGGHQSRFSLQQQLRRIALSSRSADKNQSDGRHKDVGGATLDITGTHIKGPTAFDVS